MKLACEIIFGLLCVLAILQKDKWKMMLIYAATNIVLVVMYLLFGRYATAAISAVAAVRMIVYMIYALKKIKPNLVWLIIFESAFVVSTALTWQDALDLMPLFALMASCYGGWQDNQIIMRLSFTVNGILYVIYDILIGAYIAMSIETIILLFTVVSFIYYCVYKKETPLLELIFKKKKKQQSGQITNSDNEILS
jgi:hypothetical protein